MSDTTPAATTQRVLSLRLDEDIRAQLDVLAQLNERSLTEECRLGLEHWVTKSKTDPGVLARAEQVRAEIERDAEIRRNAITAVLGTTAPKATRPKQAGS